MVSIARILCHSPSQACLYGAYAVSHCSTLGPRHVANHISPVFVVTRFKLFLEPKALRDAGAVDPRLPALPVCVPALPVAHYPVKGEPVGDNSPDKSLLTTLCAARKECQRSNHRLPFLYLGIRQTANNS